MLSTANTDSVRCTTSSDSTWEWALARPHPSLSPGVRGYRGFRLDLGRERQRWDAPDGLVSLWLFNDELTVFLADGGYRGRLVGHAMSGLRTGVRVARHLGYLEGVEVLLEPWAAYSLCAVPMDQLVNRLVRPEEILGSRVRILAERIADSPSWADRFAHLDTALLGWLEHGPPCAPQVESAWRALAATGGMTPIRRLVHESGWGWRQLDSRFREQIGLSPKTAARVLRLRRALHRLDATGDAAGTAAVCGFSDQAHLCREMRAMAGRTPRRYLAERATATTAPAWDRDSGAATVTVSDV